MTPRHRKPQGQQLPGGAGRRLAAVGGLTLAALAVIALPAAWRLAALGRVDPGWEPPSQAAVLCTDRNGAVLRCERGAGGQWQIPVPLHRMSPWLAHGIVAVEDKRFWSHAGVDWIAAVRAARSNLTAGRRVSGASTLTMQLARLAWPGPRGWWSKALQVIRARQIESHHPKEWILEQYLNLAPFGGNLVGVEAASQAYFGKPAADLTLAEAALLIGLPQRPAVLRPDRHPGAAAARRSRVLGRLAAAGLISAERAARVDRLPLGVLQRRPGEPLLGLPRREALFCAAARTEAGSGRRTVVTTLDQGWQDAALTALRLQVTRLSGVQDGAAVIVENATGAVRAMVGTLDIDAPGAGWVDAARRPRSPGSAFKPFIVAAALDAGLALPETVISDAPLAHSEYRPGNFDGRHRGEVALREALCRSLNPPAVRLLQELEPAHAHAVLLRCGLGSLACRPASDLELSLALGAGEVTLLELTGAYAGLANGGRCRPPTLLEDSRSRPGTPVFSRGSATLVLDMLSTYPLPGAPSLPAAWKTGTSNGQRDAWCFALNRDVTIGVWLGNKSGRAAESLVGTVAAVPVVADILNRLYAGGTAAPPLPPPGGTVPVEVCGRSGLPVGPACAEARPALGIAGVPTRLCPVCGRRIAAPGSGSGPAGPATPWPRILSPRPGTYRHAEGVLRLPFTAAGGEPLHWFVNDVHIGRFASRDEVILERGSHQVRGVRPDDGSVAVVAVRVE